jgi:thiosulfate dehydrogenase [quinone] large subunit
MGAAATVTLPARDGTSAGNARFLRLTDVDGRSFTAALANAPPGE